MRPHLLLTLFASTCLAAFASADITMEDITFEFHYSTPQYQNSGPYCLIASVDGGDSRYFPAGYGGSTGTGHYKVAPGAEFVIAISGLDTQARYGFTMSAPPGYSLYVTGADNYDFQERTAFNNVTMYDYYDVYHYKLVRDDIAKGVGQRGFGEAGPWVYDRPVWEADLGALSNGNSAGVLAIRKDAVAELAASSGSTDFSPSNLFYEGVSPEVEVIKSSGKIRQVFAPTGLADVVTHSSSSFSVRMFDWSNVGSKSGSLYTLYGSPSVTYTFTRTSSTTVNLIKKIGSFQWITRLVDTASKVTFYDWIGYPLTQNPSPETLSDTQLENAGLRMVVTTIASGNPETRTTTESGKNASGDFVASSVTRRKYKTFEEGTSGEWGPELVEFVRDSDGNLSTTTDQLKTTYDYFETASSGGTGDYKKLKKVTNPSGAQVEYDYYDDQYKLGRVKTKKEAFGDTPGAKVTTYQYTSSGTGGNYMVSSVATTIDGQDFGKTTTSYSLSGSYLRKATIKNYSDPTHYQTTQIWSYRESASPAYLRGLPYSVKNPDGSKVVYRRYLSGNDLVTETYDGFASAPSGFSSTSLSVASGPGTEKLYVVPNHSTMQKSVVESSGLLKQSSSHVCSSGSSYETVATTNYYYDPSSRLENVTEGGNTLYEATFLNGRLDSSLDETGVEKIFTYDDLGRVKEIIEMGQPATSASQTGYATNEIKSVKRSYEYDGSSRQIKEQLVDITSGSPTAPIVRSFEYDQAGRLTKKMADCCDVVRYVYGTVSDETTYPYDQTPVIPQSAITRSTTVETQINADGGTIETIYYKDGDLKQRTGTATTPLYIVKKKQSVVDQISIAKAREHLVNVGDTTKEGWTLERLDWLWRLRSTKHRNDGGYSIDASGNTVNTLGTETITEYEYNLSSGRLMARYSRSVLGGGDYIAPYRYQYNGIGQLELEGMDIDGSGLSESSASDRITKHEAYLSKISNQWWSVSKSYAYPSTTARLVEESRTRLTPVSGELGKTVTIDSQGNVTTGTSKLYRSYGVVVNESQFDPAGTGAPFNKSVSVSKLGLPVYGRSPSNEPAALEYDALRRQLAVNGRDQVRTRYAYKSGSHKVEQIYQEQNGGSSSNLLYEYEYTHAKLTKQTRKNTATSSDEITRYAYTPRGEVEEVWGNGTNPVKSVYDEFGRKTQQFQYQDSIDGATFSPGSSYSLVTWAYAPSSGVLRSKSHVSGTTANTEYYQYNELGALEQKRNARGITTDYLYSVKGVDLDGAGSGAPIAAGVGTGELRRENHSDATPEVAYTYDKMGRTKTVADYTGTRTFEYAGTVRSGYTSSLNGLALYKENLPDGFYGAGNDFVYGYETAGSNKVPGRYASVSYNDDDATWSQSYRGADGRLQNATASGSGFSAELFANAYDSDSHHLESVTSGSYLQKRTWESWRENLRHSYLYWGSETSANNLRAHYEIHGGDGVPGMTTQSQLRSVYLYNDNLNSLASKIQSEGTSDIQYSNSYDARGQLKSWSTSRTSGNEAAYEWDAAGNPTDFDGTTLTPNGFNQLNQYGYDADGDLTSDGTWTYRYDANNRLYRMSGNGKSLQFKYDYMGRRVEKKVWNVAKNVNTDTLWTSAANTHLKFAYQGMELVAELNSSGGLRKSFHWGLDKSDTRGGAGGAMGLLMWRDHTTNKSYYPSYDLNGNVTGLLDSSGTYVAWYEYDGFGNPVVKGSKAGTTMADDNPIRFSTQYTDDETGLVYYGFRYYAPGMGRFLTRDPIGEAGGLNLYRFVGNDPVNGIDRWGLKRFCFTVTHETLSSYYDPEYADDPYYLGSLELNLNSQEVCVDLPDDSAFEHVRTSFTNAGFGVVASGGPSDGGEAPGGTEDPGGKDNGDGDKKNNFTKRQCQQIREVLLTESIFGTRETAQQASLTFNDEYRRRSAYIVPSFDSNRRIISAFNSSDIGSIAIDPVKVTKTLVTASWTGQVSVQEINMTLGSNGSLDLDWFTDLTATTGGSASATAAAYMGGKSIWAVSKGFVVENWHLMEPGERTAIQMAGMGVSYRDIFSKDFFERECGQYNIEYPQ